MSRRLYLGDGSYTMQPFTGRGFGINRNTFNTVSNMSRSAKPYVMSLYKKAKSYLSRGKTKRSNNMNTKRANSGSGIGRQIPAAGGGESRSFFTRRNPKIKGSTALQFLGKNTVCRSSGFSTTSAQGVQSATLLNRQFDVVDVINIFTAVGETTAAAPYRSAKAILLSSNAKALITNAETTNVHFTIFEVLSTTDAGTNNLDPASTFLAGNVDANGGAAADATIPGTSPYSNPRFVQNYRILQKTPIILSPGQTHVHNIKYDLNKVYSLEKVYSTGSTTGGLAGVTISSFIVQHGTPVHDDTTETSVTIGLSKLDIVLLEEISFQQMIRDYAFNSITTTLATNLTGFQMAEGTPADVADAA